MSTLLQIITFSFWLLLFYYSVLTIFGIISRTQKSNPVRLDNYPSVAVLIPAYNEELVISDTLLAMSKLNYAGDLQIYILNDNSQDNTGNIANYYAEHFENIHHMLVPEGQPKGKSRVLNYGIAKSDSDYIAVYDADNQPEPDSLRLLVEAAETIPNAVGAVGYVKTVNEEKNFLTRMIALEFSTFQLLMQAGRWALFKLGSLTGTNMVVRREALQRVGGYDPYALAEDADLTISLTEMGGLLPIVPGAKSWEQEPESFKIWLKQRTRWMQGNIYLIEKTMRNPKMFRGRNLILSVHLLFVYILFVIFLVLSDVWFMLGIFNNFQSSISVPLLILWFESWLVFYVLLVTAQFMDKTIKPMDLLISFLMYFSYAQLWLVLLVRGVYFQAKLKWTKNEPIWDKTKRYKPAGNLNRELD